MKWQGLASIILRGCNDKLKSDTCAIMYTN